MKRTLPLAAALLCICASAHAAQGRIEISPHDLSPDNPTYVITEPGSYVLTGVLPQHDQGEPVIQINADFVTLDLGGFGVLGTWTPSTPGNFVGHGVAVSPVAHGGVIKNGFVANVAGSGVSAEHSNVERVRVRDTGNIGIFGDVVHRCDVTGGTRVGIDASVVTDSLVRDLRTDDSPFVPAGISASRVERSEVDVEDAHGIGVGTDVVLINQCYIRVRAETAIFYAVNAASAALVRSVYRVWGPMAPPNSDWLNVYLTTSAADSAGNVKWL